MLGIEGCKPFEVLNLGKYERQYWQGITFGEAKDKPHTERALYEYLAFILKLYGAQPLPGSRTPRQAGQGPDSYRRGGRARDDW